jgi:hypothetical protein
MKMNKFAMVSAAFILGAISVISFLGLVSFTGMNFPPANPLGSTAITATNANTLLKAYLTTADTPATPVKGVFVDRRALDAMNQLAAENSGLAGFRIYFGKQATGLQVGIVVGVDANYADVVTGHIYQTDSPKAGPCPTICDKTSPITQP